MTEYYLPSMVVDKYEAALDRIFQLENDLRAAESRAEEATLRADRAEALLKEARGYVTYVGGNHDQAEKCQDLFRRIDAHLSGKAKEE